MKTQPDMWRDKPEREDRTTSYQTLDAIPVRRGFPMWGKVAAIVVLMFGLLLAVKSMIGW
jgi:hypothetical protein